MDVSIAVSLIRGQMGAVVERAVNVAVETVLAEMLKVVGVKFEELKSQVVLMKKEMAVLQREKNLKDKENDNIRARLRYTELKLKYYRQGVEEELQQRSATLVHVHPPCITRTQHGEPNLQARTSQECTSSQSESRRAVPTHLLSVMPAECLDSSSDLDATQRKEVEQEDDCEWTVTVLPHADAVDAAVAPPPGPARTMDSGPQSVSLSPDVSTPPDSSMLPPPAAQVKQEVQPQEEEQEEEVICIKEEPEEEQEGMATLLLDCQVKQDPPPENHRSGMDWSGPLANHVNPNPGAGSTGPSVYGPAQFSASVVAPLGDPPRQVIRPWPKDLSLYEEYKLRRNELRRRNLNRRRELEKTLPQPLLADLVRERREKTRLRVARWRAKRKLQACLNQAQPHGSAAGLSQNGFPVGSQQLAAPCASISQQRRHPAAPRPISFLSNVTMNATSAALPLVPSSSLLLRGPSMAPHEHTVTSSSSSYRPSPQSITLTDSDLLQ